MAKLFGCIMELHVSAHARKHGKRAYGLVDFRKHHSTINHLVPLQILMKESCCKGKVYVVA